MNSTTKRVMVWHKFWSNGMEQHGVTRVFDTMDEARQWASQNIGNWQFEEYPAIAIMDADEVFG
jgi:hypothetical protein